MRRNEALPRRDMTVKSSIFPAGDTGASIVISICPALVTTPVCLVATCLELLRDADRFGSFEDRGLGRRGS